VVIGAVLLQEGTLQLQLQQLTSSCLLANAWRKAGTSGSSRRRGARGCRRPNLLHKPPRLLLLLLLLGVPTTAAEGAAAAGCKQLASVFQ
jgi:hypothetical protein